MSRIKIKQYSSLVLFIGGNNYNYVTKGLKILNKSSAKVNLIIYSNNCSNLIKKLLHNKYHNVKKIKLNRLLENFRIQKHFF